MVWIQIWRTFRPRPKHQSHRCGSTCRRPSRCSGGGTDPARPCVWRSIYHCTYKRVSRLVTGFIMVSDYIEKYIYIKCNIIMYGLACEDRFAAAFQTGTLVRGSMIIHLDTTSISRQGLLLIQASSSIRGFRMTCTSLLKFPKANRHLDETNVYSWLLYLKPCTIPDYVHKRMVHYSSIWIVEPTCRRRRGRRGARSSPQGNACHPV